MNNLEYTLKTLKVRVKDKHSNVLCRQAIDVNTVFNYINELSYKSIKHKNVFLSNYDIQKYTDGSSKYLKLHSQTIQAICKEYVTRRKQFKKSKLKWRKSYGSKRSLGWIPVNTKSASWKNGQVYFNKQFFSFFDSYGLSKYEFSFSTPDYN